MASHGIAKALRPLSPAHAKAKRDGGDVVFTWVRRTRLDGDAWELSEVPLGEETESYPFKIYAGAVLKRSVTVTAPAYRYLAADIATDFGAMPSSLDVNIAQVSASFGAGATLLRTLNV